MKLQRGLEGCSARILVRLHSNRVFYAAPEPSSPHPVGRPRRHGKKFDLKEPGSWQEPTRGASETLREIPWTPEGQPLGTGQASSGAQNGHLSRSEKPGSSYVLVSQFFG